MKTLFLCGATIAILGLAVASMSAQTQSTTYVQTSKLVGTKVKSSQGEEIGVIKDVVIDRSTGCMAYTVLSTGEGGARVTGGAKLVAVPWAVYSTTPDVSVLTVTVDRERIYNAPVFDYARIDEYSRTDYITNIYSYYGVSAGAGAGVGVSQTTTTGVAGGAAGSPSTTASPAATGSPAATASPRPTAGGASPRPRATAAASPRATAGERPYGTATPSTRGAATTSPSTREERGVRGRPEVTVSPSGGAELEGESSRATRESPPEATSPPGKTKPTPSRPHRKPERPETNTPSEGPEEQE
jgi:sporulation protein YlmC with PRC-barrel domain